LLAGSLAIECNQLPSDILDPYRETLWGESRLIFDMQCIKEVRQRRGQPETTVDKVRRKYEELGIDYHG
jgi:hypothetical protein